MQMKPIVKNITVLLTCKVVRLMFDLTHRLFGLSNELGGCYTHALKARLKVTMHARVHTK